MNTKKTIDVRNQVTLSFEKSFRFCRKGISYRLFRSSLTLAVVVVAVAFFTVLVSESLMVRATSIGVSREMARAREADTLLMHLFYRYSSRDLSAKLATMRGKPDRIAEFARVVGISSDEARDLAMQCHVEQQYLTFFNSISPGKRVVLVKKNTGRRVFKYLADPDAWDQFVVSLGKMRSVRLPAGTDTLRTFLDEREPFMETLDAVRTSRSRTIAGMETKLSELTGGVDAAEWLGRASDAEVEQWRQIVTHAGFDLAPEPMARVHALLKVSSLETRIAKLLQTPAKREEWKVTMQSTPGLEEKLSMLTDKRVAGIVGEAFTPAERASVVDRFARMKHLRELIGKLPVIDASARSVARFLDGRQTFLVIISFLVCMVGITNAMLMSITERFREIATMKCLGATDGFILKQFLIEAAIQGVVGGTAGMLIGMIISIAKSSILFGGAVFSYFPGMQMVVCACSTVLIGVLLAMLASIYPAKAAASMAPMDAMRVE